MCIQSLIVCYDPDVQISLLVWYGHLFQCIIWWSMVYIIVYSTISPVCLILISVLLFPTYFIYIAPLSCLISSIYLIFFQFSLICLIYSIFAQRVGSFSPLLLSLDHWKWHFSCEQPQFCENFKGMGMSHPIHSNLVKTRSQSFIDCIHSICPQIWSWSVIWSVIWSIILSVIWSVLKNPQCVCVCVCKRGYFFSGVQKVIYVAYYSSISTIVFQYLLSLPQNSGKEFSFLFIILKKISVSPQL